MRLTESQLHGLSNRLVNNILTESENWRDNHRRQNSASYEAWAQWARQNGVSPQEINAWGELDTWTGGGPEAGGLVDFSDPYNPKVNQAAYAEFKDGDNHWFKRNNATERNQWFDDNMNIIKNSQIWNTGGNNGGYGPGYGPGGPGTPDGYPYGPYGPGGPGGGTVVVMPPQTPQQSLEDQQMEEYIQYLQYADPMAAQQVGMQYMMNKMMRGQQQQQQQMMYMPTGNGVAPLYPAPQNYYGNGNNGGNNGGSYGGGNNGGYGNGNYPTVNLSTGGNYGGGYGGGNNGGYPPVIFGGGYTTPPGGYGVR